MAMYSIRTTRQQEVGLKFAYDTYADKQTYPTQESYFQFRIDMQVSNPLYADQQRAMSQSFDDSFKTIPEADQPVAKTEIEAVITTHGGTVVPPGNPMVNPMMAPTYPPPPIPKTGGA
jgi:hypothetical protein